MWYLHSFLYHFNEMFPCMAPLWPGSWLTEVLVFKQFACFQLLYILDWSLTYQHFNTLRHFWWYPCLSLNCVVEVSILVPCLSVKSLLNGLVEIFNVKQFLLSNRYTGLAVSINIVFLKRSTQGKLILIQHDGTERKVSLCALRTQ